MKKINDVISKLFNTRKKRNLFAILLLSFIALVGVTIAYFRTDIDFKNLFKSKPFNTTVYEVFESPDSWTPGTTTPKEVYATNDSDVDVMVRVSYTEQWLDSNGNELPLEQNGNRAAIINLSNTQDWTQNRNYYNYNYTLKPGETTSSFMESVTFNQEITGSYECITDENGHDMCTSTGTGYDGATYKLIITVEMMQADGEFYEDPRCQENETCIAQINDTKYISLEGALDSAVDGDTVLMINNTTESVVNTKDVTLDLNGYTVTGAEDVTIQNNGKLKIIGGGSLENNSGTTINNEGTLQLGEDDGIVSQELPEINGTGLGIEQNGIFNFYDGIITAEVAVAGLVTDKPEESIVYVDHLEENNYQEEYLIDTMSSRAVAMLNGILYVNLQDAINTEEANSTKGTIYIIRDAELAYTLTVDDTASDIVIDLDGYNIETGYTITNNGNLKLIDEGDTKGSLKPSVTMVNNKNLTIDGLAITETTDANVIENKSNLTINNSTITAAAGYAVYNTTKPTLTMDNNSTLKASSYALYNKSDEKLIINGGTIYGIYNYSPLEVTGTTNVIAPSSKYALYSDGATVNITGGTYQATQTTLYLPSGNLIIDDGTITSTNSYGVFIDESATMNGGTIRSTGGDYGFYNSGYFVMNDGTIESNSTGIYAYYRFPGTFIMNGGTITANGTGITSQNATINNGTINARYTAISNGDNSKITGGNIISRESYGVQNSTTLTITGGKIVSNKSYSIYNSGTLTIGSDDDNVGISTPILQGTTYGLYISSGTVNFYDGIFKGQTSGYYGTITSMPEATTITQGTETIEEVEYKTAYLTEMENFIKVGDNEFNSLQKAFDAIETEGTAELIANASITSASTIPVEKNITFDLAGYTLSTTKTITNNGTLTITDTSEEKTGKLSTDKSTLIANGGIFYINEGTLYNNSSDSGHRTLSSTGAAININGGKVIREKAGANIYSNNSSATITISGGNIEAKNATYALQMESGKATMSDGSIIGTSSAVYMSSGSFIMEGGTIKSTGGEGVNNYGTFTMNGGTIISTGGFDNCGVFVMNDGLIESSGAGISYYYLFRSATFTMNGGTIKAKSTGVSNAYINIKGGTIISTNSYAIDASKNTNITAGTITSENNYGIYSNGTTNITGGTIISNSKEGIYTNGGTLTIGTNDDNINITTPVFQGSTYGLNINSGTVNVYDGIFKGQTKGYNGTITTMPEATSIKEGTETIEEILYQTAYLAEMENFVKVGDVEFNSLQKAFDAIETEGTAVLIANASITSAANVESTKNITLDLAGYTLATTQTITNNGTLTITDTSAEKTGMLSNNQATTLNNVGVLSINEGTIYNNSSTSGYHTILSTGSSMNINGGKIIRENAGYAIYHKNSSGIVTINAGEITGTDTSALYQENGNIIMNDGTVYSNKYAMYISSGTVIIENGLIESSYDEGYLNYGTTTMNNGTIKNTGGTAVYGSGKFTLNNGLIESKGHGVESYYNSRGTFIMNGGRISSNNYGVYYTNITLNDGIINAAKTGVYNTGTSNIKGGTITSESTYGIYSSGTLNLGSNDGSVDVTLPIIQGSTYGIYINSGTMNFYDGIIKGQTGAIYGNVSGVADQTYIYQDSEIIEELTYETKYLKTQSNYVINETSKNEYNDLALAISEANSEDILTITGEAINYKDIEIPTDTTININLNGNTLGTSKTITNNGTLKIYDTAETKGSLVVKNAIYLVKNYGTLEIENINIVNELTSNKVVQNYNGSTMTLKDMNINSLSGIYADTNTSVIIEDSNITVTDDHAVYCIANLTINGGTISGEENGVYYYNSNSGILSIDGANISGTTAVYNYSTTETTLSNITTNGKVENGSKTKLVLDGCTINGGVLNTSTGTIVVQSNTNINSNTTYGVQNKSTGNVEVTGATISMSVSGSVVYGLINSSTGTLTTTDTTINMNYTDTNTAAKYGVYNSTGTITATGLTVNISDSQNKKTLHGIYNNSTGTITLTDSNVNVTGGNTANGVYVKAGTITLESGSLTVNGSTNAYGAYINEGTFNQGIKEGTVVVDNPTITAIGTTGIGVKKINGYFMYYDGKITGSTNAKPETTTEVEYPYEATLYTDATTGYEYYVLEYLEG